MTIFMEDSSTISEDRIMIAWAMPVSLPQLGARLEAYVETKAAITTLRSAARYKSYHLIEEIIQMIASNLQDIVFRHKMKSWIKIYKCATNTCSNIYPWVPQEASKAEREQCRENLRQFCEKLSDLDNSSRFGKCVQIFKQDFRIRPYFSILKYYRCSEKHPYQEICKVDNVQAEAFLTLPVHWGTISSEPGPRQAGFYISETIDPSRLMGLGEARLRRLRVALRTLKLHPYDPDEDESLLEDEPRMHEHSSSDTEGGSDDSENDADDDDDDIDHGDDDDDDDDDIDRTASDKASPREQETAEEANNDGTESDKSNENGLALREDHGPHNHAAEGHNLPSKPEIEKNEVSDSNANGKLNKVEEWPQLMMLGSGDFWAYEHESD